MVAPEERAHWLDQAHHTAHGHSATGAASNAGQFAIALALLEVADAISKLATAHGAVANAIVLASPPR